MQQLRNLEKFYMNTKYKDKWLSKANKDLKTALELFSQKDSDYYEIIAFHCQQCVEKYLKGFLSFHGKKIEKIHSIENLLLQCNKIEDFSSAKDLVGLTVFAVNIRYPDYNIVLTESDLEEIVQKTNNLIKLIDIFLSEDRLL